MLGIMDCCYHAVPVIRLLRKVYHYVDWPLGGYGVLVLPPMSARAARVGECFGLCSLWLLKPRWAYGGVK